jgi:hypothetical protein
VDSRHRGPFQTLKETLCTAFADPQPRERFIGTDASDFGIRGMASQVQDGQERIIAYYSKTLNKAERNYCII